MARKNGGKKVAGGFVGGVVATIAVILGLNQFGVGLGDIGGDVIGVFSPQEQESVQKDVVEDSAATIKIAEDKVYVDGDEVAIKDLTKVLDEVKDEKVTLIDDGASHATWAEVVNVLEELNCIIEKK